MSSAAHAPDPTKQADALLWLGGAIVVGMALIWLALSRPWSRGAESAVTVVEAVGFEQPRQTVRTAVGGPLEDNPLRMAQLALEAGMLVEPEEYSAWTLYRRALQQDPSSQDARRGLESIAAELLRRANVAVEQGRIEDARAAIERIRAAMPVHPAANDLAFRIDSLAPRTPPHDEAEAEAAGVAAPQPAAPPAPAASPVPVPASPRRPEPRIDPVLAAHERFVAALEANQLLTPAEESAKHHLAELVRVDAEHELTRQAQARLFGELLARAHAAIDAMDAAAANTWIDEAEHLAVDAARIVAARSSLRGQLLAAERARRVPASALSVERYTPPQYPQRALERGLEGWVDIEFTVGADGATRDVEVTDASHNSFFRKEAAAAVEQWRFEPRVFMGEVIEQRAYTRIRFDFE
jgi:TonB family protein